MRKKLSVPVKKETVNKTNPEMTTQVLDSADKKIDAACKYI